MPGWATVFFVEMTPFLRVERVDYEKEPRKYIDYIYWGAFTQGM